MLPSRRVSTARRFPISRASKFAPRHAKTADLGEGIEYFLCHPITEVLLVSFCAKIGERQDSDRTDFPISSRVALRLCFCFGKRRCCRPVLQSNLVETD